MVDGNVANTFDNNTYPIRLGRCWHVMMMEVPKSRAGDSPGRSPMNSESNGNVAVLVRGGPSGQEKVRI